MVNKDTLHTIEFKIEAVSTQLDEDQYINTVADIISKHLGYALVGVFLFDVTKQIFGFKAGTGVIGQKLASLGHQIPINKSSDLIGAITAEEIRINDGWSDRIFRCSGPQQILPDSRLEFELLRDYSELEVIRPSSLFPNRMWEVCLPLRIEKQLLGAMYYHIYEFRDFSFEDCSALQWLADQIAEKLAKLQRQTK